MKLLKHIALCWVVCSLFATAVVAEETSMWSGKVEFGGLKNTGNANTLTLDGAFEVDHIYGRWETKLSGEGTRTKDDDVTTSEYYGVDLKSQYNFPIKVYAFSELDYREDLFGGTIYQWSGLVGLGYHLFVPDSEIGYLVDFELGKGKRQSKKVANFGLDNDFINHAAILGQYAWTEDDVIKAEVSFEWGNDDENTESEISWVHTLFESVTVDISHNRRTTSKPSANNVYTDTKTSVKFGYEF
ncbi:MAG: DUF481 domain-containing protein [Mariprofundaceae bacterium]